jgi:hypothetical protein
MYARMRIDVALRAMQKKKYGNCPDHSDGKSFWRWYTDDGEGRHKPYANPETAKTTHVLRKSNE